MVFSRAGSVALEMLVGWWVHHFGPDWNASDTIQWIAMKFVVNIHIVLRMNPNNFHLTFYLSPP